MSYVPFGKQNLMMTSFSKFDPGKGQCQVKLGQISSVFKIKKKILIKPWLPCLALSQDSKNVNNYHVQQLEMPKNAFQKVMSSPLPVFWPLNNQK